MPETMEEKVASIFAEVMQVAEQVRDASTATDENKALGRQFATMSRILNDKCSKISEDNAKEPDEVYAMSMWLGEIADFYTPKQASHRWSEDDIKDKVSFLIAMSKVGDFLTADQMTLIKGVEEDLSKKSGLRGPRTEAEKLPDRPDRIVISYSDNRRSNDMSGNTVNSPGNVAYKLASVLGLKGEDGKVDTKSDRYAVLREYSRRACKGSVEVITVERTDDEGNAIEPLVITLTPTSGDEE